MADAVVFVVFIVFLFVPLFKFLAKNLQECGKWCNFVTTKNKF